jgi:hypothetical protein
MRQDAQKHAYPDVDLNPENCFLEIINRTYHVAFSKTSRKSEKCLLQGC